MREFRRIAVYCGSSSAVAEPYFEAARYLGRLLAERGIGVVYGGGRVGLMGVVADSALEAGGEVMGVIPRKLQQLELGHTGCTELFVVDGMHTRKALMAQLSDAFIALPGGWGTLEEIFEATSWTQLNYQLKPVGLLNVEGYYDPLIEWIARAAQVGFIRPEHAGLLEVDTTAEGLLRRLAHADLPRIADWIDNKGRIAPV